MSRYFVPLFRVDLTWEPSSESADDPCDSADDLSDSEHNVLVVTLSTEVRLRV